MPRAAGSRPRRVPTSGRSRSPRRLVARRRELPTYASGLTEGASSYPFRGTLRCSYPISRVEVRILNAAGGDAITPATASPGSKSFDLSSLDNSVAFSRLRAGGYTLVITAESGAPTDGTFRLESPFYVSGDGFTVTFDPCGGTCGEAKRAVYAGQCYGDLPTAAKDGWTFDGWYTAPEGGSRIDGADIVTAGDHTLYAHYSREYSYVFYNYDGTAVSSGRLAAGEEIPAPDQTPSRPSDGTYYYVFTGWSGYSAGMTISDNVSFTAAYEAHEIVGEPDQIITSAYVIRDGWAAPASRSAPRRRRCRAGSRPPPASPSTRAAPGHGLAERA